MKKEKRQVSVGGRDSGQTVDINLDLPENNKELEDRYKIPAYQLANRELVSNIYDRVRSAWVGSKTQEPIRDAKQLQAIADGFDYEATRQRGPATPQGRVAKRVKSLDEKQAGDFEKLAELAQSDPAEFKRLMGQIKTK